MQSTSPAVLRQVSDQGCNVLRYGQRGVGFGLPDDDELIGREGTECYGFPFFVGELDFVGAIGMRVHHPQDNIACLLGGDTLID